MCLRRPCRPQHLPTLEAHRHSPQIRQARLPTPPHQAPLAQILLEQIEAISGSDQVRAQAIALQQDLRVPYAGVVVVDVFGPAARGGDGVVVGGEARPADAEEVGGVIDCGFQGRGFGWNAAVDACCVGGEGREGDVVEARRGGV